MPPGPTQDPAPGSHPASTHAPYATHTPETWREVAAGGVSVLALVCIGAAWAVLLGWGVGEAVSDRYFLTQFLEWVPTLAVLVGAGVLLSLAWVLTRVWTRIAGRSPRAKRGNGARRWGWAPWAGLLVYFFIVEVPIFRSRPPTPDPGADRFKLVVWNASSWYQSGWEVGIGAADPDIVVIVGLGSTARLPALQSMMKGVVSVVTTERFTVLSKRPIVRYGATSLGLAAGQGIDPRLGLRASRRADPGNAMFFEVRHPATAKTPAGSSVIQALDLPSDLSLLRWDVTTKARSAMDTFAGPVYAADPSGRWVREDNGPVPSGTPGAGFPIPDIVAGDFNIPRGADSLHALDRGYPSAFDQAGRGFMASYPRSRPILHIDQTFLAPGLRTFNYRLIDLDAGSHRAQVVDIARERAP